MKALFWGAMAAANGALLALGIEHGNTLSAVFAVIPLVTALACIWSYDA